MAKINPDTGGDLVELEDISIEEIRLFYNSLTVERDQLRFPLEEILKCKVIKGVRVGGKLAGMGGVTVAFRFLPAFFYVVKSEFQGRGISLKLERDLVNFARKHYDLMSVTVPHDLPGVVKAHQNTSGFKLFYDNGDAYHLSVPFNKKGKIISKFLPLLFRIYDSPIGSIVRIMR